ncbi:nucleotide disphospho-sugar-binding domain-containing protein [Kitasatospora sp. NPDC048239]|uniref:nucleotide disphospho-sugar-binding domain-containing protein n=1 Tax=Kitasatospora sp. NPDC048239 TaxID=3364046 RepID=UPI0037126089
MRVLFTVSNWAGHWVSMVPLAWALRAAGHEVRVACAPQQVGGIASTGLMPVSVLDAPDMMESARLSFYAQALALPEQDPGAPLPLLPSTGEPLESLADFDTALLYDFWGRAVPAVQRSFDNAVEYAAQWRPDLVVYDLMAVEGALVALLHDVPGVYVSPGFIGTVETEPGLNLLAGDPLSCFEKYGVDDWSRARIRYAVDPSPDAAVPPLGDALRIPMGYVPYNGAQDVDPGLLGPVDGKRVCIVWGNSATGIFGTDVPALRQAVESAARQAAEVVLTAGPEQVESLGGLPPNVRVLRNCPIELILPECDVLVHHGSANCLMNGIAAGLPQLALALNYDALVYGRRIDPTGAVRTLPGLRTSAEEIDEALAALLHDPAFGKAAQGLQDGVRQAPSPARVADLLIGLARTGSLTQDDVDRIREDA